MNPENSGIFSPDSQPTSAYPDYSPLPTSNSGKKKKILLLSAIILLVAALAITLVLVFSKKISNSILSLEESFKNYAECIDSSDDFCEEEYEEYRKVYKSTNIEDEELLELLEDYDNKYTLLQVLEQNPLPDDEKILSTYESSGSSGLEKLLNNYAKNFEPIEPIERTSYFELLGRWSKKRIEVVEDYSKIGCIKDGRIDYICAVDNPSDERQDDLDELLILDGYIDLILEKAGKSVKTPAPILNAFNINTEGEDEE